MRNNFRYFVSGTIFFCMHVFMQQPRLSAQITVTADDVPNAISTIFFTEDDTVESIEVDPGLPGENQTWTFDYEIPGILNRQQIVPPDSAPFNEQYPAANIVTRYIGNLGNLIHTYYFDKIEGEIYSFQKVSPDSLCLQGIGIGSSIFEYNDLVFHFSDAIDISPDLLLYPLPLAYGDSVTTVSHSIIEVDTSILSIPVTLTADINDSIINTVDGWGTINLPDTSYECLRLKSLIHLDEKILFNGNLMKQVSSHSINLTWIAKYHGVVARMMSHTNHSDTTLSDRFTIAKQVSRLNRCISEIILSSENRVAIPGDTITVPLKISDVSYLDITSLEMDVYFDRTLLKILDISNQQTLCQSWDQPSCCAMYDGVQLKLCGSSAICGSGVLCYVRFLVNPMITQQDTADISLENIYLDGHGLAIRSRSGKIVINAPTEIAEHSTRSGLNDFLLYANYPNPFNAGTSLRYDLSFPAHVSLTIYNSLGQQIRTLIDASRERGSYSEWWDGKNTEGFDVPSGLYFSVLKITYVLNGMSRKHSTFQKMLLLK
ncbi:hypothetical protein JW960_02480 [candidate division KSB1 bacterium]|nr:hypothetical protein [candidate division KSB1 bacterium]